VVAITLTLPRSVAAQPEEAAFRALIERYYAAVAAKDIAGLERCWHPGGPARSQRNVMAVDFELRDVALAGVTLSDVGADPGGGRARVMVDVDVTTVKTQHTRRERRVRDMTFLLDDTQWKIWNDASAGDRLAQRLVDAPATERDALLTTEPELASDDALAGLTRIVARLRGQGMSPSILDVLGLQGRLARRVGNHSILGRSLLDAGLIHQITGNATGAVTAYQDARAAFVEAGDAAEVAACDQNLGNAAYALRDYAKAGTCYQQALDEYEALKDEMRAATLRHSLGNATFMLGEFEKALELYQQGLTVFERGGDPYSSARVLQAMGQVHKELGNYGAAADVWTRSAALSLTLGDTTGAATALQHIGEARRLLGDHGRALEAYSKSLALWERSQDVNNRAATMFGLGQVYASQRSFAVAEGWYRKALDVDRKSANEASVARDLGGLGGVHLALGQPVPALEEYQESLSLREKLKDTPGIIWTLIHISVLHAIEDRHSEALTVLQRSLDLAGPEHDTAAECTATALRARSLLASGETDASLLAASRALEIAAAAELPDVAAHAQVTTGRAYRAAGRLAEARAAFEAALAALGRASVEPGAESFFSDRRGPYLAMVDLLVAEQQPGEAFLWTERMRQRALADMLGGDGVIVTKGMTTAEIDNERQLRRGSRNTAVRLRRERARVQPDAARLADLQAQVERLAGERAAARQTLYAAHPVLEVLRAQSAAAGLEGAATLVPDARTAILSFVVSEARAWVFVIARDHTSGMPVIAQVATIETKADDLIKAADAFTRAAADETRDVTEPSRALRRLLIDPVQGSLEGKTRLVIVPDAFLWNIPFEALQFESGRYLVEDTAVSYGLSVTALAAMAASDAVPAPAPRKTVLVVAAPAMGKPAEERLALVRPAAKPATDTVPAELRALRVAIGTASFSVLEGPRATAFALVQGAGGAGVLHVAAPVLVSHASPLHSLVALTPAEASDADGGLVELVDVMGWDLRPATVVFSRAESGTAAFSAEGFGGLSWSLFVAGPPSVAVNRWALGDAGAFVTALHRSMRAAVPGRPAGRSLAEALQRAAKGRLAQPATRHPRFWAGLAVLGR
jgi:tetratricopeptide (TPR) repeat protein